ncbi:MAG: chorismate synthase [Paludibacteraceae bacterium]|nr:chorismate synthase [Paludibacteraceae bacterium]
MNTLGEKFSFTSFGESHGKAIGGVLDGVPAGVRIDMDMIHEALDKRAGRVKVKGAVSPRALREGDEVEWLSGVMDGVTLGTPIAFIIRNKDARPEDYEWLKHSYRIGHADRTYQEKYGIRDHRGGGRASARETASRVVAGSVAQQLLKAKGVDIKAKLVQVGEEKNPERFDEYIAVIQRDGDSIGGIVECVITGLPIGVGEPIFDKLQSHLAFAMMSINGCKGFEYGSGFESVGLKGSEMYLSDNHTLISGGIAGGISDGTPVVFRCVFKPTASNRKTFEAIRREGDEAKGKSIGRHDACIAVRAVAVVEAMAALVLQDFLSK